MVSCRSRRRSAAGLTRGPPHMRWGSRPCPPFPLLHASWRGVSHTSLPMHHVSWPRVAFASPSSHQPKGGGRRPLGWAPQNPWRSDARLEGGGARRCAVRAPATLLPLAATPCPPPVPPLSPTPTGAARPACAVRARAAPCCIIRTVRAARRAEGPRTAPSAPPHNGWR